MSKRVSADPRNNYSRVSSLEVVRLNQKTIDGLIECLNIDDYVANITDLKLALVYQVESVLGEYKPAVNVLDNKPRPVNIVSAISPVIKKSNELFFLLIKLNDEVIAELKECGLDTSDIKKTVKKLHNSSLQVKKKNECKDGRQGVTKKALKIVIIKLQSIFNEYHQFTDCNVGVDERKGVIKYSSDEKYSLNEFVKYCLKAANIKFPRDLSGYLDLEKI